MNIFLTGATGYIGSAVATALREAGHDVAALVRAESDTRHLRDLGVYLLVAELEELPALRDTFLSYDALVHTAVAGQNKVAADRAAVETFSSMPGHFVYTSGVWVMGNTTHADESTPVNPLPIVSWRPEHEQIVLDAGGSVVRPGCVYGGKQSLFAGWFADAEQQQPIRIVGDGGNRWAMVDVHELAEFYVRAVQDKVSGVLLATDDTRATLDECARALSPQGTIEHQNADDAREKLGMFADALLLDQQIDSRKSRELLDWSPKKTFTSSISEQWQEWKQTRSATD